MCTRWLTHSPFLHPHVCLGCPSSHCRLLYVLCALFPSVLINKLAYWYLLYTNTRPRESAHVVIFSHTTFNIIELVIIDWWFSFLIGYFFKVNILYFNCEFVFIDCCWGQRTEMSKYGRYIGDLARDVSGQVYAVSDEVLFIKGFVYGGTGPGIDKLLYSFKYFFRALLWYTVYILFIYRIWDILYRNNTTF